jgi:hypothetical protein
MSANISQPTEIEAGAGAAANNSRALEHPQQTSEQTQKSNTIEGDWLHSDPKARGVKHRPAAARKHLTISRNQQGGYYATMHDPNNFLRLEEFRGTDREYWMVAATAGRKRIYRFYGVISEDGLTIKGRFTVYTPDGLIARKMAIKQYRSR